MADEEEIVVSVGDDSDTTTKKDGSDDAVAALKSQFEDIKKQAESEKAAREAAESRALEATRRADIARREAQEARKETTVSQADTIEAGIAAAQAEIANAEAENAKFLEAGDYVAAAKATSKGQIAAARLVRLDEAKADLEARKDTRPTEVPQGPRQSDDPVEAYIAGRSESTAQWLRAHRDWVTDPKKNAKLTSAHWAAIGEGHSVDTEDYFKYVETTIGLRTPEKTNGSAKPQQRRSAPVAPVTASGGSVSGGGNEVRLSQREAAAATDGTHVWNYDDPSGQKRFRKGDPIGVQEFARRKLQMTKDGLYDKSFTEA